MKPIEYFATVLGDGSLAPRSPSSKPSAAQMAYAREILARAPGRFDGIVSRIAAMMAVADETKVPYGTSEYGRWYDDTRSKCVAIQADADKICASLGWKSLFGAKTGYDLRTGAYRHEFGVPHQVGDGPVFLGNVIYYPWD